MSMQKMQKAIEAHRPVKSELRRWAEFIVQVSGLRPAAGSTSGHGDACRGAQILTTPTCRRCSLETGFHPGYTA